MYEIKSRVRYSETDQDAKLSYFGIMNYLQDCSIFHSEDCGVGVLALLEKERAWLLTYWDILIERRPSIGEEITVSTWPYDFKGIFGYRNFLMKDAAGLPLVKADSYWILADTVSGNPVRVTDEFALPYGQREPRLDMEKKSRKISLPQNMEPVGEIRVVRDQLDTNHHVNNARYVDMAREVIPEDAAGEEIREIRVEYKKAAILDDDIILRLGELENGYTVSLQNPENDIFANVELIFQAAP